MRAWPLVRGHRHGKQMQRSGSLHSDRSIQPCGENTRKITHLFARNQNDKLEDVREVYEQSTAEGCKRRAGHITSTTTTTSRLFDEFLRFIKSDQHATQEQTSRCRGKRAATVSNVCFLIPKVTEAISGLFLQRELLLGAEA